MPKYRFSQGWHRSAGTLALSVSLMAGVVPACGGSSSNDEAAQAVSDAKQCLQSDGTATDGGVLPAMVPDVAECFRQVMDEEAARRFLLGVGNVGISEWAMQFARALGDRLAARPEESLPKAEISQSRLVEQREGVAELARFYEALADGLRSNVADRREAAGELAGVLSLLSDQTTQAALASGTVDLIAAGTAYATGELSVAAEKAVEYGREHFDDAYEDSFHRLEAALAIAFWADERVRARLLAGESTNPQERTTPPPTETGDGERIDPPLEDGAGVLRIPSVDDQPAHDAYFNWLERGGGVALDNLAKVAGGDTGLMDVFDDVYRRLDGK